MMRGILDGGASAAVSPRAFSDALGGTANLRSKLQRPFTAFLKGLTTASIGACWEQTSAAGMDDHELARINRRNELDPDGALREFGMTPFGMTRRP